jgi:pimeloyl-ACP methyl ester carboxylesterase
MISRKSTDVVARTVLAKGCRLSVLHLKARRTAILLIHGNSSCKEAFAGQLRALHAAGHSVVVPDLPGHGGSMDASMPSRTYSFPGYAAVLAEAMKRLGHDEYHVVGWSLGGHIGLEMWASLPCVKSLLITGTPPIRLDAAGVNEGFRWTSTTALAGRNMLTRRQIRRYTEAMMGGALPPDCHLIRMAMRTDGLARQWMVRNGMAGVGRDELDAVRETDRPIAILQGRSDPFLNIGYLEGLDYRNIWRDGPVYLDAGHAPHWEIPAIFNARMIDFLKDSF